MIAREQQLTILKVSLKEGVGKKSGSPYSFYTASVVDEDANVFGFSVSKQMVEEHGKALEDIRNESVEADIEFKPKGFDVSGTLLSWQ